MARREYVIAADSAVYCSPRDIEIIYGPYATPERGFGGIQAAGWRYLPRYLDEAAKFDIPVVGVHGRIGPTTQGKLLDIVKMNGVNSLLYSTPELIKLAHQRDLKHIVVHTQEARANMETLALYRGEVRVEGDVFSEVGIDPATQLVKQLRRNRVNATVNPDVAHLYLEKYGQPIISQIAMELLIRHLESATTERDEFGDSIPQAIHCAFGENKRDSVDVREVKKSTLGLLAQLLDAYPWISLGFENQLEQSLYLPQAQKRTYQQVTVQKMDHLAECGVI